MSKQTWLITGGAGYIGAHIADKFLESGSEVVIYDSLFRGRESRIEHLRRKHNSEVPLIVGDVRDSDKFEEALNRFKPDGIIHTAALKSISESFEKFDEYFEVNYEATKNLLKVAKNRRVHKFIFSSTAAVYGSPNHSRLITEDEEKHPISPYGASKLAAEEEVNKFLSISGNFGSSLRFFNVIGSESLELLDRSTENLIPILIEKLINGEQPTIFGSDYETPDGTCIRDYVDVRDIAKAHVNAARAIFPLPKAMNVGTGLGTSVRQVINLLFTLEGKGLSQPLNVDRRLGDPAFLCADVSLIASAIGFSPEYSIENSLESLKSILNLKGYNESI